VDTRDSETKDIFENPDDLNLYDSDYGPLVLPGPVLVDPDHPDHPVMSTTSNLPSKYSYSSGWPSLNTDYLDIAQSIVHPLLQHVICTRKFALEKVDRRLRMVTRSPSERLSYRIRYYSSISFYFSPIRNFHLITYFYCRFPSNIIAVDYCGKFIIVYR
jgi:hypothetical protein